MSQDTLDLLHGGARAELTDAPAEQPICGGPGRLLEGAVSERRLREAKFSYTARGAIGQSVRGLIVGQVAPCPGDVVLARIDELGQHKRLELPTGRRAFIFPGDEIVVCYGNRYAPDQFEAEVPDDLSPCHLVAAGGVASSMLSRHVNISDATKITPLGLLANTGGAPMRLAEWELGTPPPVRSRPLTFAVVGSSMNAGKTTTAANLVKGLADAGHRVGAAKVTGTGAGGDLWFLTDSGANPVYDFTWVGLSSTYLAGDEAVETAFDQLVGHLAAAEVDVIVLEVADGIYQDETASLLRSRTFVDSVDGVVFAATDALGAAKAVDHVSDLDLPLIAISGVVSGSPLAMREARAATEVEVVDLVGLRDPARIAALVRGRRQPVAA